VTSRAAAGLHSGLRLAWTLAKRDLRNRYASSHAGIAWNIGIPLLYALINVVVFSLIMKGRMGDRYDDVPFALFYFVPFSLWTLLSETSIRSTGILREYSYLINKIAFPTWILPLIPLTSALLSQAIVLVLALGLMIHNGIVPSAHIWIYLPIWALTVALSTGFSYMIAAIAVYVHDVAQVVPVALNILFWLTPILYPTALIDHSAAAWVRNIIMVFNPFYYLVEATRLAWFGAGDFPWHYVGIVCVFASIMLIAGCFTFRKLQPGFADVI
jgi:lipopolysaccharide transport system permease protein